MLPMLVHWGQAVLASNDLGSFRDWSWLTTGTPKSNFLGVGLTPRRRLNSATCNNNYKWLIISLQEETFVAYKDWFKDFLQLR